MKRLLILSLLLIIALLPHSTVAQSPDETEPIETPIIDKTVPYADLLLKAQEKGQIRVIVQLDVAFQAEGNLSTTQATDQRQKISRSQDNLLSKLTSFKATVGRKYSHVPALALTVDGAALQQLITSPEVKAIQEDLPARLSLDHSTSQIGANNAWKLGFTGGGWTVAVLDTGFDSSHPFLQGKVVSEACYSNTDGYLGVSSLCPNGRSTQIGTGAAKNCSSTIDGCEHGTHVAGIVAGRGTSFSGVAKDATLIAIQVFFRVNGVADCDPSPAPCIFTFQSDYMAAMERVLDLRYNFNIAAINMSLGGEKFYDRATCDSKNQSLKWTIDNLRSAGIATVVASGNNGYVNSMNSPGCISSAISVGAVDDYDKVTSFSNSAYFLDLLAPGMKIYSSIPGNSYESISGTSMATPHVAGAWAVRKSAFPSASVDDILAYFKRTGKSIRDSKSGVTTPRIQLDAELSYPSFTVQKTANMSQAKVGDLVIYNYRVVNTGNVNLTIEGYDSQFYNLSFSPNPVAPGETTSATENYRVTTADLPGPLFNLVTVTGTPPFGSSLTGEAEVSVDLTEILKVNPAQLTSLSTTDQALHMTISPYSLPTNVTQFYYTRVFNPVGRLPAVFSGLAFNLMPVDNYGGEVTTPFTSTLVLNYNTISLPSTVKEKDLGVYFYDSQEGQWITATVVASDTFANTITIKPNHVGIFALTGQLFTNFVSLPLIAR